MGPTPVLDKYKLHPAGGYCTCKMHAGSICPACTRVRQHSANWEGLTPQLLQLANAEYDRKYNRTPESGDCIRAYFFRSLIMPDFDPNLKAYSLVELGAQLLIRSGNDSWVPSPSVPEAQGLMFLCPKCYHENHREDCGVHSVVCWFPWSRCSRLRDSGPRSLDTTRPQHPRPILRSRHATYRALCQA
jgi:hypothetical protein